MEKRKLQHIFWRFCPFIFLDYIKGMNNYFSADVPQIGLAVYICLSCFMDFFYLCVCNILCFIFMLFNL